MNYFDIKKDLEIEKNGGFFCQACLISKDDKSPDPRYCELCYEVLLKEVELLVGRKPTWVPKQTPARTPTEPSPQPVEPAPGVGHNCIGVRTASGIMSTLGVNKQRGPKHKDLPVEMIAQWASEGMSSRAIATSLKTDGISVSYRTIQRVLSGERKGIWLY